MQITCITITLIPLMVDMPRLLLVLAIMLQGFFSWYSSFRSSTKTSTPNSNLTRKEDPYEIQLLGSYGFKLPLKKYCSQRFCLFIYLIDPKTFCPKAHNPCSE